MTVPDKYLKYKRGSFVVREGVTAPYRVFKQEGSSREIPLNTFDDIEDAMAFVNKQSEGSE